MERVITSLLVIISIDYMVKSFPIHNGFTVKFNPISFNEELKPKSFGALFAKIRQDPNLEEDFDQQVISKTYFRHLPDLSKGCTNQVARLIFPIKGNYVDFNNTESWDSAQFISLPLIKQPFDDYKIVVVTAPPNLKVGRTTDAKPMVIYVVLPDEDVNDPNSFNIPSIYFVNKASNLNTKEKVDPILIIDSNRTVTGLKSKAVSKFIKFRNKITNRYAYEP